MLENSVEKALFCFEFFVETIQSIDNCNITGLEVKFDSYEWLNISQERWNNVGKRCYLISEKNFLRTMLNKQIRVRALCDNCTSYSCDINLNSFHITEDTAYCKGLLNLYSVDDFNQTLQMRVSMRVFNVENVHDQIIPCRSVMVDQDVQTDSSSIDKKTQTGTSMRTVSIQTSRKSVKNQRVQVAHRRKITAQIGTQCSINYSTEELKALALELIAKLKAAKARNLQISGIRQKGQKMLCDYSPRLRQHTATNDLSKKSAKRFSLKRKITSNGDALAVSTDSVNVIGSNAVSRIQQLRTLDNLIAQKTLALRNLDKDRRDWKPVARICRTAESRVIAERTTKNNRSCKVPKEASKVIKERALINDELKQHNILPSPKKSVSSSSSSLKSPAAKSNDLKQSKKAPSAASNNSTFDSESTRHITVKDSVSTSENENESISDEALTVSEQL